MSVDQSISESEFGIKKMRENTEPFDLYFKGTLATLKGALDYLLDEYNTKYSVGVGDDENPNPRSFKDRVGSGKNPTADAFIDFYRAEKKTLLADPKCRLLLETHGTRDIAIHRREIPKSVSVNVNAGMTATLTDFVVRARVVSLS
jgi:hypothetical protein